MAAKRPVIAVLTTHPYRDSLLKSLASLNDIATVYTHHEAAALADKQLDCIVCAGPPVRDLTKTVFDAHPECKWVHSWFVGVDALRPFIESSLKQRPGAKLTNARGAYSHALGEYAMTAMLHFNKQITKVQHNSQKRVWDQFQMNQLSGKTLCLVGYGDIAKATGRMAKAFNMRVVALRASPNADGSGDDLCDAIYSSTANDGKDKLTPLREADYVMCSLPGTPNTHHFMGEKEFAAMPQGSVFVSLGRGFCVDESALSAALDKGHLGGAALDVFEKEPLDEKSPLWNRSNVLITAHNADQVDNSDETSTAVFRSNIEAYIAGEDFVTLVDVDKGY